MDYVDYEHTPRGRITQQIEFAKFISEGLLRPQYEPIPDVIKGLTLPSTFSTSQERAQLIKDAPGKISADLIQTIKTGKPDIRPESAFTTSLAAFDQLNDFFKQHQELSYRGGNNYQENDSYKQLSSEDKLDVDILNIYFKGLNETFIKLQVPGKSPNTLLIGGKEVTLAIGNTESRLKAFKAKERSNNPIGRYTFYTDAINHALSYPLNEKSLRATKFRINRDIKTVKLAAYDVKKRIDNGINNATGIKAQVLEKTGIKDTPKRAFEKDFATYPDAAVQRVLREVDARDLTRAMVGLSPELTAKIYASLSQRAVTMLQEDIAKIEETTTPDQITESQQRINQIIRRLKEAGELGL